MRAFTTALIFCLIAAASMSLGTASDVQTGDESLRVGHESEMLTREEWRERVEQAKLRAREFVALARSGKLQLPRHSAEKVAEEASSIVMSDQSLQQGDIVSTHKGLFRFNGKPGSDPQPSDFTPLTLDALSARKK